MGLDSRMVEPPTQRCGGETALFGGVVVDVPAGWTILGGGVGRPPLLAGITSFVEFADEAVVVTVLTREYSLGPERLLQEITGEGRGAHHPPGDDPRLILRPEARGCTRSGSDGIEEYFVASLVVEQQRVSAGAAIGVEFVAAGPTGAVAQRLPVLFSLVSSIGYR